MISVEINRNRNNVQLNGLKQHMVLINSDILCLRSRETATLRNNMNVFQLDIVIFCWY